MKNFAKITWSTSLLSLVACFVFVTLLSGCGEGPQSTEIDKTKKTEIKVDEKEAQQPPKSMGVAD